MMAKTLPETLIEISEAFAEHPQYAQSISAAARILDLYSQVCTTAAIALEQQLTVRVGAQDTDSRVMELAQQTRQAMQKICHELRSAGAELANATTPLEARLPHVTIDRHEVI